MNNKIVRTICYFSAAPSNETLSKLDNTGKVLTDKGYEIQTKRVCSKKIGEIIDLDRKYASESYIFGLGSLEREEIHHQLAALNQTKDTSFNLDLSKKDITLEDVKILLEIIRTNAAKTFGFTYVFNNPASAPFFPSANYQKDGFSIGLQPTDLAEDCSRLEEWLEKMQAAWQEIISLFKSHQEFLGIDSSVAPLFSGKSSLINFVKKLCGDFNRSVTSDIYSRITEFIKTKNPQPVGLCGLMFPCLEDFELAEEYEQGNFSVERNLFLSLQCGLGIDTYPVGIDEKPERILEVLRLTQSLSNKHQKALSVRLVSDGKAKIGEKTDFKNQYLKDVVVRPL